MSGLPPELTGLLDPAAYPRAPAAIELRETHISWVLLAGDRAYKLKKPLRLPFLDYGSLERRHRFCREEVRLNRRLAPEVYLGVRALVPVAGGVRLDDEDAPGAVEYAVEMRRYDEGATLARRAVGDAELQAVGRRLAAFHAGAELPADPARAVPALEATLKENFASLRELGAAGVGDGERLAAAVLAGRRDELGARARAGLVRDGHGDLRAEHVVLERGIEVVDCVEFDPALREIDTGFDIAFLAMDLMRRDERRVRVVIAAYRDAGGDPGDDALLTFFTAQRALIRAKVALVRAGQVTGEDAERRRVAAGELLALAARLGWRLRLGRVAVVCGAAATGKSTVAQALAARSGAHVLSSDIERKALLGLAPTERASAGGYTRDVNRRTYEALGHRAGERLALGEGVIVDATFRFAADRQAFASALGGAAEGAVWIECRAPAGVLAERAAARLHDARRVSDADADIAVRQLGEWEPLSEMPGRRHVTVATDQPPEAVVAAVAEALEQRLVGSTRPARPAPPRSTTRPGGPGAGFRGVQDPQNGPRPIRSLHADRNASGGPSMTHRTTSLIPLGTWTVDPTHSTVGFAVKHMGIANVRGEFTEFEGTLGVVEDLASSSARGTVKVTSITTGEEQRDEHLRSADFFNVEEFPEITFESSRVEAIDDESTSVVGNLTMHGVTRKVKLKAVVQGTDVDPWGKERAGVEVVGVLKRSDFDMKFNQALGSGNVLVGDKVNISLDISAVRQE